MVRGVEQVIGDFLVLGSAEAALAFQSFVLFELGFEGCAVGLCCVLLDQGGEPSVVLLLGDQLVLEELEKLCDLGAQRRGHGVGHLWS